MPHRGVTYEQVKEWALALPGTAEVFVQDWGHPTLRVNNKMFASGSPGSPTVSVKASTEDQAELVAADPKTYSIAPYVGRYGWVRVQLSRADPGELRELIVEAWRRTAPKRLAATFDPAHGD
ncbi:MAG: MmcQ/YjbR family DNA-binding protein [Sporichthyaceae bacterium]|nr:MmcQ/YjbR family DNA-binding protein [Sporichthyaceae bacterium]